MQEFSHQTHSRQQEAFCKAWVEPIDRERLGIFYLLFVAINVFILTAQYFVDDFQLIVRIALAVQAMSFPILAIGVFQRRDLKVFKLAFAFSMLISFGAVNGQMIYQTMIEANHKFILIFLSVHIMVGLLYPHAMRQSWILTVIVLGCHTLSLWIALSGVPFGIIVSLFLTAAYLSSFFLARGNQKNEWMMAQSEFKFRSQIVPAFIASKTAKHQSTVTDVFKPALKFCVCLSSDWRNFSESSKNLATSQVTESLSDYYDLCQDLLQKIFPLGNVYIDWLGKELFIVAYTDKKHEEKELVNKMVQFGLQLSRKKTEFSRIHGLPSFIDIAIAAGSGVVGVMGPPNHLKATTLGDIPGMARNLQVAGHLLREKLGHRDRIILSREVLMLLTEPITVSTFDVLRGDTDQYTTGQEVFYTDVIHDQFPLNMKTA